MRRAFCASVFPLLVVLALAAVPAFGAIVPNGDVQPTVIGPFNPIVVVGNTSDGSLLIDSGSILSSSSGGLGSAAGATGTVTISDVGSEWIVSNDFSVGSHGNGVLVIESGAKLTSNSFGYLGYSDGSTGSVTVNGAGSEWNNSREIYVGRAGSGTLVAEFGGKISSWGGFVGQSDLPSSVTVTGAGSKWTSSTALRVERNGTLIVSDGGEIETGSLYGSLADFYGNGTIKVTGGGIVDAPLVFNAAHGNQVAIPFGSGGNLTFRAEGSELGVGFKEHGSLVIAEGVTISSKNGHVGYGYGSSGVATISGAGSQWSIEKHCSTCNIGGSLGVGIFGDGSLNIEAGGNVSNAVGKIGSGAGSTGSVRVLGAGSSWSSSEYLYIGDNGNGTLIIEDGGIVTGYSSRLAFRESSTSTATVTGSGSFWESNSLGVGGKGNGTLNITSGGLVKSVGLTIDSDLDNDSFLNMATGGMLALAGDADDSLTQFLGLVSGTDAIRYWDGSQLDWVPLTSATYGTDYTLQYLTEGDLAGYTLLTVGRVGDFDNDGDVDGRDYLAWQRNPELGNLADWQSQYADGLPPATTAVPEPTGFALMISLAISCLVWPRNRV